MKSIYDMMGKYTYPTMQDDAPREHVESFFQVKQFLQLTISDRNSIHSANVLSIKKTYCIHVGA